MAKPSLTSQFDAIQAQLEAAGLTVRRDGKFALQAWLVLQVGRRGFADATATISISQSRDKSGIEGYFSIHGVSEWADPCNTPAEVLTSLLAKPFGRTTIGAVFGISTDLP